MSKLNSENALNFFKAAQERMMYLAHRWNDEQEYEDIADYKADIQKLADQFKVVITKMKKRPFGCEFAVDGHTYAYTCSTSKGTVTCWQIL